MLGKTVTIDIFGTLADRRLYSGFMCGSNDMRQIYVITNSELHGTIDCTIIAAAVGETSLQTRLVAAPVDEVFYEPDIVQRLSNTSLRYKKINCIYEKSCGAVIYRINEKNDMILAS